MGKFEDLVTGTFTCTRTKKDADFYGQFFPKEEAAKLAGTHWTMAIEYTGNGTYFGTSQCQELPEWNHAQSFTEGIWQSFNIPSLGGKGKMKFDKTADGFETDLESEGMGKVHYSEKYTPEALHLTTTKDGKSHKETWPRKVQIEGSYKYKCNENMEQFLKEDGLGDFVSKFAQHYKNRWSICGDEFIVREWWGEPEPVVHRFKLNQETNFNMPGWPNGKMLVTQRGPAKFTMNIKMPEGKSQEWKLDFCDKGMMQEGKNLKTGTTCKIWCERFHDICGKWKPVAITGVKEGLMNLGLPAAMCDQFANEYDMRITFQSCGGVHTMNYESKLSPIDMTYKYGEPVTVFDPVMNENCEITVTKTGCNKLLSVSKYSKITFLTYTTHGDTFMTFESVIDGFPGLTMAYVMERDE